MYVLLKIDNWGSKVGNNFTIVPNVGIAIPSISTKVELYNGIYIIVDNNATYLKLTSNGECSSCLPQTRWKKKTQVRDRLRLVDDLLLIGMQLISR